MDKFELLRQKTIEEHRKKQLKAMIFDPLSIEELTDILGLTIKSDEQNKVATFLCQLSAYTKDSQFNISFVAPSSTGKSYIPIEVSKLFPKEDVITIGYCSPTAFFHDQSSYNKETSQSIVDLERKVLIFLDQPHTLLLQHLRPLLSHDKKEINLKITDRSKRQLRTKNIVIKGFPAVIFCTAGLKIDEQETTRFLLLSPETSQEKIREAVTERLKKEADSQAYNDWLEQDPKRQELKKRVEAIKELRVKEIRISKNLSQQVEEKFFLKHKLLKPRHSRDISRLVALAKSSALLNLWTRKTEEDGIIEVKEEDFNNAFKIWRVISESQELNLPPYILELYKKVISSLWKEGKIGITRQNICKRHYEVYGRPLSEAQLRQDILPMLEQSGLIFQEADPSDKRRMLVFLVEKN